MVKFINNFFLIICLCCCLFGRCHSFRLTKRRFGPRNYAIHFSRGGDISDGYTDADDTFSQFIESFESELSKIRQEAEIEAEIEMQKLLGLVDDSRATYEEAEMDEYDDEQKTMPQYDETEDAVERDETEDDHNDVHYNDAQAPGIDQLKGKSEDTTNERKDGSYQSGNELESPDLPDDEEDTYDLDERDVSVTLTGKVDTLDNDATIVIKTEEATVEDEIDDVNYTESADNEATLQAAAIDVVSEHNETISLPTTEHKKQSKSKSKKKKAAKSIKKRTDRDTITPAEDEVIHSSGHGLSTITITDEIDNRTSMKGLQFYLQSDLVRAVFLFIATVAVSIWLQRVQRQLEAEGI